MGATRSPYIAAPEVARTMPKPYDVAIVGGGIAGAALGHELAS
jgi:glycerol-3-phosphate dehydrogenase